AGLVAAFPKRARAQVAVVDVANVAPAERLHQPRQGAWLPWGQQQVHVVGHQHVGVHGAVQLQREVPQVIQVAMPVDVGEEAGLAVVAALDDVLGETGEIEAWTTGHGRERTPAGLPSVAGGAACICQATPAWGVGLRRSFEPSSSAAKGRPKSVSQSPTVLWD